MHTKHEAAKLQSTVIHKLSCVIYISITWHKVEAYEKQQKGAHSQRPALEI